ncbi:hypothetical protein LCGC14_1150720 [marine sediment metagenome]|uniref:Uncharacterized protein n=1 Tax=marine sediment metagenome TaxID=412755 RepID=A0A0F9PDP3_9ZZZZ
MGLLGVDQSEFDRFSSDVNRRISEISAQIESGHQELTVAIQNKATESETVAKHAASQAIVSQNDAKSLVLSISEALDEMLPYKDSAIADASIIDDVKTEVFSSQEELGRLISELKLQHEKLTEDRSALDAAIAETQIKITELDATLAKRDALEAQVGLIGEISDKSTTLHKSLVSLHDNAAKRRGLIDDLYFEIFGREVKAEDGSVQQIEGLKDELDAAYDLLSEKIKVLDKHAEGVVLNVLDEYTEKLNEQEIQFEELIADSKGRVDLVDLELKALMPGGMAAGLSAAYEAKAKEEVVAQDKYANGFQFAIFAMIAISSIPFAVDAYLLIGRQLDILEVIRGTPNLIVSILPLYFPVLWFAYSVNKKLNLSKRLIEEYTHKAVLGKTFSGLSGQIESLPHEDAVKGELKTRLLFNLLQVSAENPGKLITDYNKTDHPLMDALDKSAKLSDAMEALARLPGFSSIAEKVAVKSREIVDEQSKKVRDGLHVQDDLDGKA